MKPWLVTVLVLALLGVFATAADTPPAPVNLNKAGTYTSGKWTYTVIEEKAGHNTEKKEGTLSYDGKVLDLNASTNDYVRTPWGPMYWAGKSAFRWGPRGWMPQPNEGEKRIGRELSVTGVPVEEVKILPILTGTAQEIVLGKEACGDYVEAFIGQVITVKLPGNPTTGYEWQALPPDHAALAPIGPAEYHKEGEEGKAVGVGGTYVFHFRADQTGAAKLTMIYKRSWEKEAAERFTVMVRVAAQNEGK